MRAEYDSEARALWIEIDPKIEQPNWVDSADVGAGCTVALDRDGRAFAIDVLGPEGDLAGLVSAAKLYGLDVAGLRAAARAALEAPDRPVTLELGSRAAV